MELNLFPPEDTQINCKTPEGEIISIDALDLDEMVYTIYEEEKLQEIPRASFLPLMCKKFKEIYGFAMSKRSMDLLIETKTDILNRVKKNSFQQSDPVNTMESLPETIES